MASVQFLLNNDSISLGVEEASKLTLNEFLRFHAGITGTKLGCGQGGCGACTVVVSRIGANGSFGPRESVMSCLMPVAKLHGASVTTIEGLMQADGKPHPISERLARFNGSQCGFCTPGMVMQLFSTLSSNHGGSTCSAADLEHCIDGNICRCTGYRPIIECAKSFLPENPAQNWLDPNCPIGPYDVSQDPGQVMPPMAPLSGELWRRPTSMRELKSHLSVAGAVPVAGHTAHGIYPELSSVLHRSGKVFVDITGVPELSKIEVHRSDQTDSACVTLVFGSCVTWSSFVATLDRQIEEVPFLDRTLASVRDRCASIASPQVRNVGTLGGNLTIARSHGFQSDWVPLLCALGAEVEYERSGTWFSGTSILKLPVLEFMQTQDESIGQPFITRVHITVKADKDRTLQAYRVAKRGRNAHALANAAFAATVTADRVKDVVLVVGAIAKVPLRLRTTEKVLSSLDGAQAKASLSALYQAAREDLQKCELRQPQQPREVMVAGFITKFVVALFGDSFPLDWRSASINLHDARRATVTQQCIPPAPVALQPSQSGAAITKTSAMEQTTGRAKFTDDMPRPINTLFAALVLCPEANVRVIGLDDSPARKLLGSNFKGLVRAEDLPSNEFPFAKTFPVGPPSYVKDYDPIEELLLPASVPSRFAGQPIAVLLASDSPPSLVEQAAAAVTTQVERVGLPDLDLQTGSDITEIPITGKRGKVLVADLLEDARAGKGGHEYISGNFQKKSQSHFYMEPQSCVAIPDEDTMVVTVSSQMTEKLQVCIAHILGLPESKVIVKYRRVGGGFGGKVHRTNALACLAAATAHSVRRPVRLVLPRAVDMKVVGGRQELEAEWQAAVEPSGRVVGLRMDVRVAHGAFQDMQTMIPSMIAGKVDAVYAIPNMEIIVHIVKQHLPPRTAVRGPGRLESTMLIESVIDGVASHLGVASHVVREANFYRNRTEKVNLNADAGFVKQSMLVDYANLALWNAHKQKIGYEARCRQVDSFNIANKWKKRGISMMPGRYGVARFPGHTARVDIFKDGSLQVGVAGSEIGQGLHTKVGQVVCTAFELTLGAGPPISAIRFLETSTEQLPAGAITAESTTSEVACLAAEVAVQELVVKLRKYVKIANKLSLEKRDTRGPWFDIIGAAFSEKLMGKLPMLKFFSAMGMHLPYLHEIPFDNYGVATAEVELDVLSGESKVVSVQIMYDIGVAVNPMIDIGQVEGAFMMGLGQQLLEGVNFDAATGKCLTDNTWTYKPPIACDMPEQFRVELVNMEGQRLTNPACCCISGVFKLLSDVCGFPWKASRNSQVFKSGKAVGEPPLVLACSVLSALSWAVRAARDDTPLPGHSLPVPAQPDVILELMGVDKTRSPCTSDDLVPVAA